MTRSSLLSVCAALTLVSLPATALAQSGAGAAAIGPGYRLALAQLAEEGVLDEAHLFSPDAIAAARAKIQELRREYHCAVFIDTVNQAPASGWSRADSWSASVANTYFHEWAKERAQAFGVEGIFILICKDPWHVAVVVWLERFEAQFNAKDRDGIERLLRNDLVKAPNETLLTTVDHIGAALEARRHPEPSVPFGPLGVFIGGAVGGWLLLALVRLWLQKPEPFSFTGGRQTARLTACLLAGMFGNPATYWITDRLYPKGTTGSAADILLPEAPAPTETLPAASGEEGEQLQEPVEVEHE